MPVNHEIKSQLAKLLATEDLVVEHKKISTACFNVHTRVLTLPMWDRASNVVYDMLVGHEVGHALYTSYDDWKKDFKIPKSIMNIVEDARIEKLMKRRYAGIAKTFYNGYKELSDEDFFSISDTDISKMNLADRANLLFKIGNYVDVPINENETRIINMIAAAETFQDVVDAATALYEFCKIEESTKDENSTSSESSNENSENQSSSEFIDSESNDDSSESNDDSSESNDDPTDSNTKEEKLYGGTAEKQSSDQPDNDFVPEVKTMDALNDAIEKLINMDGGENSYIEIPKLNLDTVIIKNKEIHDCITQKWESVDDEVFTYVDSEYNKFKYNSKKEVSYLIKEFECKKSADQYSRSITARTGVLNTSKLHTYKFNEDLFKKISVVPDGQNHGLIFILDWSGSMNRVMLDTIKQLYNILWFCQKVNIPFDVYAFTEEWHYRPIKNSNGVTKYPQPHYEKIENVFSVGNSFSLLNMLSSEVKNKNLNEQMRNIFRIAYSFNNHISGWDIPSQLGLSATPLNESLIALHQIIPQFKIKNKLQKTHCIVLSDGESSSINFHVKVTRNIESKSFIGARSINQNCFIRNRKTGMVYSLRNSQSYNYNSAFTNVLLCDLRETFPDVNFIGIRIVPCRDATHFIRSNSAWEDYDKYCSQWKKQRSVTLSESGYHKYFGISSSILSNDVEFQVDDDATKSAIKNAFKKSLNSKKMNKKFLNEFIELVA
jgi:hypothetical protein